MEKNMQTGKRIQARREELGLNLGDIAQKVGVAVSTIQRYEKGKIEKIKLPVIEAIAKALAVDPAWLLGQTDCPTPAAQEPVIDNLLPLPKTYRIPLIGDIACGTPILADENIEAILEVPEHIRADFALRCHGDSMTGAHIHDGDIVYIRQQPLSKKEKIHWAFYSLFRNFDRFVGGYLGGKYHLYSKRKQQFLDRHISQQYDQRHA